MSLDAGSKVAKIKNILAFALLGAVGFGIGGIVSSVIWGSPTATITKDIV